MKKPNVLNRAMFSKGGASAYGRGITSNLVSDKQRQRYNYGGRVKLGYGTPWEDMTYGGTDVYAPITPSLPNLPYEYGIGSGRGADQDYIVEEDVTEEIQPTITNWGRGSDREELEKEHSVREHIKKTKEKIEERERIAIGEQEDPLLEPKDITQLGEAGTGTNLPTDRTSNVIDWTEFAEGLYDPKKTLGKALMQGAGTVFAASQLPKKEAAVLLGKGFGEFGKTIAERREKIEDIAATGKMYEKVNVAKAAEAGKWAVAAEKIKQGILNSDTAIYNKAALKNNKPKEGLEAVVKFDILSAPLKDGVLDEEAFKAKGEGSVGQYLGQFVIVIEGGEIRRGDAGDIKDEYSAWKARKQLASSPTS